MIRSGESLCSELLELQDTPVSKTLCRRIAAYKAELAKTAALLRATTHSCIVKAMMGPHVPESALALMKKADFLSSITGEKVTIQDIAKLSTTVRSAARLAQTSGQSRAASTTRVSGAGWGGPRYSQREPTLGPCYICGQPGRLRANCPLRERSAKFYKPSSNEADAVEPE